MFENVVERKIMWGDLDAMGIVFYPRYNEWIDASGHLFLEAIGLHFGKVWESRNIVFGLVETRCTYHRPGKYHNIVNIATCVGSIDRKSFTFSHTISRKSDDSILVRGQEKRICMNASNPKQIRAMDIPEDIRRILKSTMH